MRRATITISGRVQGVGFRYYASELAERYGIAGTVQNQRDGTVHIEAEGENSQIRSFVQHIQLDGGPLTARIEDIDVEWEPHLKGFTDFTVVGGH